MAVSYAAAEEKQGAGGPPPMLVATAEVVSGKAEPMTDFVGTVYFSRTAKVAAEVEGVVRSVLVDDGEPVKKAARLVVLDDELLATEVEGTRATYEQNVTSNALPTCTKRIRSPRPNTKLTRPPCAASRN